MNFFVYSTRNCALCTLYGYFATGKQQHHHHLYPESRRNFVIVFILFCCVEFKTIQCSRDSSFELRTISQFLNASIFHKCNENSKNVPKTICALGFCVQHSASFWKHCCQEENPFQMLMKYITDYLLKLKFSFWENIHFSRNEIHIKEPLRLDCCGYYY